MGVKYLNKYLRNECSNAITYMQMNELTNKEIVIDTSIYMYKYNIDGGLIENIYLMLSVFKHYKIIPIFIFDGKPPDEKRKLLHQRYMEKKRASDKYNIMKDKLNDLDINTLTNNDKLELKLEMDILKRKMVYIKGEDIQQVKELISTFGVQYYDAPGEADELCATMVKTNKAWACLSEDMDMFIYGVPRVIRYFSLLNNSVVLYNTQDILQQLRISQKELQEICIFSGTDYNNSCEIYNPENNVLQMTLELFRMYKAIKKEVGFFNWLFSINKIKKDQYHELKNIYKMFTTEKSEIKDIINNMSSCANIIDNISLNKYKLQQILENDGFIFGRNSILV